jgi:two-component system, OmpR family, phosphate regulon sensor histidine kinase PhoR
MIGMNMPSHGQIRILVVDDHPNTANTLARALSQIGPAVDVVSAVSGHEALDKVKNKGVDILITDMIMPEMTGLELIEKMQNHHGGRPSYTYLVTAYDVPGLKVTARRLKVNEVIVKPVRPERIYQIATQAIEEMKHASRPVKTTPIRRKNFKVLIADDEEDNITLLVRYMVNEGYEHVSAKDGVETLNMARIEMPDLILLDINMPNKDGFAALEEIRSDPAIQHIPVIILSAARTDPADIQSGLNLGADDYVTKPFDRHELMARIRTKLRMKEAEDVIRRRNRELSLLPEIGKELSARLDIKELAHVLLKRTVETLGANQGSMVVLAESSGLQQSYQFNLSDGFSNGGTADMDQLGNILKEKSHGIIIDDTHNDPQWPADSANFINSAVIVPLSGRHGLLGVLTLTHELEHYFNLEHLLLLQAIASQASIAIENASLYSNVLQEKQRLMAVLQNAAEAILMFDEEGRLLLMNPVGEELFTEFKAIIGQPIQTDSGHDDLIQMIANVRSSHTADSGEITWPDKRTFAALLTPIEAGGVVVILHDITRFKEVEKVKDEFIATASHDLKNPITSILGFSQLISQAGPLNEQQTDFTHRIRIAANTMNELVQNMMQLAQMDLNTPQKHDVMEMSALLAEMADEFTPQAREKDQILNFTLPSGPVQINGNPLQLRQLFRNLLGNAIKYTSKKGNIQLKGEISKSQVLIDIQDNGYGIAPSDLPFIFDRFYRAHNGKANEVEGNGLGLAIVKSIVEQHGGQIRVQSELDKGTCFSISFPLLINAGHHGTSGSQKALEPTDKKDVLVSVSK